MHKERLTFLTSAAALVLAGSFIGTARPAAQETQGTPSSAPAVESREPQEAREPQAAGQSPEPVAEGTSSREAVALRPGSTAPPRNLRKIGDHWTPYNPPDPESFPSDATLHVIVPGDTLWDLADLVFGNPYLWPQIWNENRYILDSHWIYPGDPLLLPARPTVVGEIVPQGQEGAPPTAPAAAQTGPEAEPGETSTEVPAAATSAAAPAAETPEVAASAPAAETPAGKESDTAHATRTLSRLGTLTDDYDLRCSGYIAPRESKPDYFIANQEEEAKLGLTEGDIVYLNRGQSNGHTEPGTEYSVVVREGEVRHPITHRLLGYYYRRLGSVKVLAAQETTAIAAISYACDEIRTGYPLVSYIVKTVPAKPVPAFNRLTVVPSDKSTGYVVHVGDNQERASAGQLVDVDLGYEDGLKPGDYLTVFLPSQPFDKYPQASYDYQVRNRRFQSPPVWRDDDNVPPAKTIGQMVVIFTEKKTATAKILQSVREIEIGDSIVVY